MTTSPIASKQPSPENKRFDAEIIRALTPIFIAAIGGAIGITVLVTNTNAQDSAGLGLAGTAIAGAAGLAQPHRDKNQPDN